jgi:hypothetical protein
MRHADLIVADWAIDPRAVATACAAHRPAALHVVVPAWLHGIDWVGDPHASVPCARLQLERIVRLCGGAGLAVESADVGDPDPLSAICDAVAAHRVDAILLFARGRHVSAYHPFGVARRAQRLTGLHVEPIAAPGAPRGQRRLALAAGHCDPAMPRIA